MKRLISLITFSSFSFLISCGGGSGDRGSDINGQGVAGRDTGFTLSGKVLDSGPVTKLQLTGPTNAIAQATLNGSYFFSGLIPGSYTLTATDPDGNYLPPQQTVSILNTNVTAADISRVSKGLDGLPEDLLAKLDAAPPSEIAPEQIVFADGQTLAQFRATLAVTSNKSGSEQENKHKSATEVKNDAIKKMIAFATDLSCKRNKIPCADPKWVYGADSTNPSLRPAQKGLAYVYGSKTYDTRVAPLGACAGVHELFGIDCSGLMHLVAAAGGINIPTGNAATQANPDVWLAQGSTSPMVYEVTGAALEIGDIIYFASTGHIGIVSFAGAEAEFIASNGGDSSKRCASNLNKGPTQTKVSYFGSPTKVLRLKGSARGPIALSGPASIPVCTGTLTVNGTGSIDLVPTPKITIEASEIISLTNSQGRACYSLVTPLKFELPLTVSSTSLTFSQAFQFTCAAPCVSGTSTWAGNLIQNIVGGKLSSITGTITHTNTNQTPFTSTSTGAVTFLP